MAGLEALDYWTHVCDCARRKTDVRLIVSNEYLSFRFGCIIEPTGFIMNKHTYTFCLYCSCSICLDAFKSRNMAHVMFLPLPLMSY